MSNKYVTNSFSLNMMPGEGRFFEMQFRRIPVGEAKILAAGSYSFVGHESTAAVFSAELGLSVAHNRATLKLEIGDTVLVGQYSGQRLPEGATSLPEGAAIEWWLIFL